MTKNVKKLEICKLSITADNLLSFMTKMDQLSDRETDTLAEWLKEQEGFANTNSEKNFLLAARSYVLDYPVELDELVPK